jgi:hypothetical protein
LTAVGGSPAGHWFAATSHSPSPSCERRCERSCVYPHFGGPRTAQSPQTSRTRCGTSLPPFSARPELPLQRFRACSRSQLRQQRTADAHIVSSSLPEWCVACPLHSAPSASGTNFLHLEERYRCLLLQRMLSDGRSGNRCVYLQTLLLPNCSGRGKGRGEIPGDHSGPPREWLCPQEASTYIPTSPTTKYPSV